ncbi:hypothetical protein GCM10027058_17270 [Microbacterium neimengense]
MPAVPAGAEVAEQAVSVSAAAARAAARSRVLRMGTPGSSLNGASPTDGGGRGKSVAVGARPVYP